MRPPPEEQPGAVPTLTLVPGTGPAPAVRPAAPLIEVVVPVHNEQHVLEASIWRLHG
jgi:hypothetical protein